MKFDKESIIVILVAGALILGWTGLYPLWTQSRQAKQVAEEQARRAADAKSAELSASAMKKVVPPVLSEAKKSVELSKTERKSVPVKRFRKKAGAQELFLENDKVRYEFLADGVIGKIVLLKTFRANADRKDHRKIPVEIREPAGYEPFSLAVPPDGKEFAFESAECVKKSANSLEAVKVFRSEAGKLMIVQTFEIGKDNTLQCVMVLRAENGMTIPRLIVWGGALDPLKQLSNDDIYDSHQLEYCLAADRKAVTVDPTAGPKDFQESATRASVEWIAASNKYFLSMLYSNPPFSGGCELLNPELTDAAGKSFRSAGIGGVYRNITLVKDVPQTFSFTFYAGPKDMAQMKSLPESAFYAIHLANWSWLEPLCRPMLWMLNKLKELTGSYGLAIILLTVIVKLVLWPLIHKGNKSMRKLQRLQPQLKDLKEKYKDQPQEFQRRMMELYSKEGVSPVGGCFPMLLQFPIFIALYYTLASAIELRQVPFLWAEDLSRPDLVGPAIYGIGLHPFILISTGLMVLQQKLSPPVGDPTQRKIMMIMPVAMLIFLYNFPSGLALYWSVNNVLSILQMLYSQYAAKKEEALLDNKKTA